MRDETMFKMKRSASAQVRKTFQEFQEKIPLRIEDAIEAIIFFFVDEDVNNSWMFHINNLKEQGTLYFNEKERRQFILDLSAQAMKKFTFELDPASRLLMMGASNIEDTINYFMRFPDCLVSNFKLYGTYGVIDGPPRLGKTALAVNLSEIMHNNFKFDILTNIPLKEDYDWVYYSTKLSDLVLNMDKSKDFCAVLDETGTYAGRKRSTSRENVDFENLARFVGKMKGRLILITHSFELDIPTLLQVWTSERYSKKALDRARVILSREGGYMKLNKTITGIPDATIPFKSEEITSLSFDISIKKLLSRVQDNVSVKQAVEEQLEEPKKKNKRREEDSSLKQIKAMVKDKISNGLKIKEAVQEVSEETGLKNSTIRQYYYM